MAEQCANCGVELFVGQRFCRACGASTDDLGQERVPTRKMQPQQDDWGARSGPNTAPGISPDTSPVYAPSGYQPSVPPMPYQAIPPYTPPRSRSRLGWVLAFIGMGLFALIVFGVMMMARFGRNNIAERIPPAPAVAQPGETLLSETSADRVDTVGNETTLTKTFALEPGSKFALKSTSGSVVIEAWDQPRAEVKVIRQGSDRGGQVFFANSKGSLSVRTAQGRGSPEVRYEIKLPQEMGRVMLTSQNGSVKLTGVSGQIFVEGANGSIELTDVKGVSKVQTANGKIRALLEEASDGPMEFVAANGSIDVTIKSNFDADLEATTVRGSINLDDQFGISPQRELVGQRARGQIGQGGQLLKITTVNGSIRLAKQ
jgi:hypothetical protein